MKKELCKAAQMMGNPLGLVCENFENEGFEEGNSSSYSNVISQIWKIIQFIICNLLLWNNRLLISIHNKITPWVISTFTCIIRIYMFILIQKIQYKTQLELDLILTSLMLKDLRPQYKIKV